VSVSRAVLLVGSARPSGTGNSEALGAYLLQRLAEGGMDTELFHVARCQRPERERALFEAVDVADLFVLSTPLYVDALPYLVTRCLERMAAHRAREPARPAVRFVCVVNCGFPESEHTRTALDISRVFARQAGLEWSGGLGLGGGETLGGKPLESLGGMTRHVRRGLDLAAEALLDGRSVPEEARALLARPMIPSRLYTLIGDIGWFRVARRKKTVRRLWDRPLG
jgi:multimeric flavodoxin WrbA